MEIILCIFVLVLSAASAQNQECATVDNGIGNCKPLTQCKELLDKAKSLRSNSIPAHLIQSIQDELFKSKGRCNGPATEWTVCCSECRTPDNKSGIIKNIRKCDHLWESALKQTDIDFVIKSRIDVNTVNVCCGPPRTATQKPSLDCDSQIEFPPDPNSKCCGIDLNAGLRITGGHTTGIYAYPWTVLLEHISCGKLVITCGGTLISNKIVVTAAHCFISNASLPKYVRLGEFDINNKGKDCIPLPDKAPLCNDGAKSIPVSYFLQHPQYNMQTAHNDIALIRLQEPVKYTDFIRPICLPTFDSSVYNDAGLFTVAGWGRMSKKLNKSRYKQAVNVAFMDQKACQNAYKYSDWGSDYPRLCEKQLCAGGEIGKDACDGDSGGPLMVEAPLDEVHYELAGVVSLGPEDCGTRGVPGIYTNVYKYVDWIQENVRKYSKLWIKP